MRVLVANRGAIARRVVRACHELGYDSIAVYSQADAHSPHLSEATEAFALEGFAAQDTYLNQDALLHCAQVTAATAVHPGYGFLSENADFAQRVIDAGLLFIGPDPQWLRRLGDKVSARRLFAEHKFPVFAGSEELADPQSASNAAAEIGYPVMIKPSGGGGGMGMVVVRNASELASAMARAAAIAEQAFGRSELYLEKFLESPRHIEFQVLADNNGKTIHLYERECSIQRRNQKLIEESPAPGLSKQRVEEVATLAEQTCSDIGYNNVGTLETLFAQDNAVGFLEMNTRIQVEHGVTEMITGVDLVQQQIKLSLGESLPDRPERRGHAVEVRIYAEDSIKLLPSTGTLSIFRPPNLTHVRVETGYQEGQEVTPYYDALLAKVIGWGETRELAIGRCIVALKAFSIQGVQTNVQLLIKVLQHEQFLAGNLHTGLLGEIMSVSS